jgi:hypothetical protein
MGHKSTGSWIRISKTVFSTYVSVKLGTATRYLVGRYPVATEAFIVSDSRQDGNILYAKITGLEGRGT